MKLYLCSARTAEEILQCQNLIASVYNKEYDVVFSKARFDLDAKIEPWPHRYLMIKRDQELIAVSGLYMQDTYVERFGGVTREDLTEMLARAGAEDRYDPSRLREVTKVVVRPDCRGQGLSRLLIGAAHSRAFCQRDADAPRLLVFCGKRSIIRGVHEAAGLNTRPIKPFPLYKVHERYRSAADPMDSRLIIPDLDIPPRWYDLELPTECDFPAVLGIPQ